MKIKFRNWLDEIEALLEGSYDISLRDLPNKKFRQMYDSGLEPMQVFELIEKEENLQ